MAFRWVGTRGRRTPWASRALCARCGSGFWARLRVGWPVGGVCGVTNRASSGCAVRWRRDCRSLRSGCARATLRAAGRLGKRRWRGVVAVASGQEWSARRGMRCASCFIGSSRAGGGRGTATGRPGRASCCCCARASAGCSRVASRARGQGGSRCAERRATMAQLGEQCAS